MAEHKITFEVRRGEPVLVKPLEPTPREILYLSNIDDQPLLRMHLESALIFKNNPNKSDIDHPATLVRRGLEKALVHYYPLAGRVRNGEGGKLVLDCNGEGILFIQAEADVALSQLGDIKPPFPCWRDLLWDIPGSRTITDSPIFLIQVTKLSCGGFIFALRFNHTACDAMGLSQFLKACGELNEGAAVPSVMPVWERRRLMMPRNPAKVTLELKEYEAYTDGKDGLEGLEATDLPCETFLFTDRHISILRKHAGVDKGTSSFEILAGYVWKTRTMALEIEENVKVRISFAVDARGKFKPPLPKGYYGNAVAFPCAVSTAGQISRMPLGYAVGLIGRAKTAVDDEYLRCVLDTMEVRGRPALSSVGRLVVSDARKARFEKIDFGWGNEPVYSGTVPSFARTIFFLTRKDPENGDRKGLLVPICLPADAMGRFKALLQQNLHLNIPSCL